MAKLDPGSVLPTFVGNAVFPRLAWRLRWWTRSTRGIALYIAFNTLFLFAVRQFVIPRVRAWGRAWEDRQRALLTERLGRAPTHDELASFYKEQRESGAS
jgi:hypothetical protein